MPIYNTEASVLRESIESILNQTFTDFEFLILNDSPDNKKLNQVVGSYEDSRIIYKSNPKNMGLEGATNSLLKAAKGEYIAIFDHDDISDPLRLEKQVQYLDRHPETGLVSAQFQVFGTEEWTSDNPIEDLDIKHRLAEVSCVSHSCMMVRKSVLEDAGIQYEKDFFPASSYRIITRLALITKVHNLPDVLLRYRLDGNNTSVKYETLRVEQRQRIQREYKEEVRIARLAASFELDEPHLISKLEDGRRYYKARRDGEIVFVKTGPWSFKNEYGMSKRMYDRDATLFVKPIAYSEGKENDNILIMEWCEGQSLEEYVLENKVDDTQRDAFFNSLVAIYTALHEEGVVHRDIIPRNFIVSGGGLMLIDLNFAVDFKQYYSQEVYQEELAYLGMLGESYAAGVYRWDDAHSMAKLATEVIGVSSTNRKLKKIHNAIGERVITPTGESFRGELVDKYMTILSLRSDISEKNQQIHNLNETISMKNDDLQGAQAEITAIKASKSYQLARKASRIVGIAKRKLKEIRD